MKLDQGKVRREKRNITFVFNNNVNRTADTYVDDEMYTLRVYTYLHWKFTRSVDIN